jgi:hypothetical protein
LEDTDEADDEDYDAADVLDYDGGVYDEGPEIVGLEARIALEVFEEGVLVSVVIWIYSASAKNQLSWVLQSSQDCFTHNSFFHVPFLLLLPLRFLSLCLPLLGTLLASPLTPFVMRKSF